MLFYIDIDFLVRDGFLNQEDEFITKKEIEENPSLFNGQVMDLFVIRLYKCVSCGKWIIDILE